MPFNLQSSKTFFFENLYLSGGIMISLLLICYSVYQYTLLPTQNSVSFSENAERVRTGSGQSPVANVLFFYADWCPHCKTAKPIWEEVAAEYSDKTINGSTITFSAIDCSEKSEATTKILDKYGVEGYPTIKLLRGEDTIDFDAKPTKENLVKFLNTVI